MEGQTEEKKKMKILCLHGFRTSGSFLQKQISKWDPSIFSHFHLDFPDGIFPAGGKSEIEGIFPPPYFEWFQFDKDFTEYTNLEECISYLCEYITNKGPFDGLLGFSQGATLSALLLGYQAQGKVLKEHPPMKVLVSISGSKFRDPKICEVAYKDKIKVKSVHFIGAKDWLKLPSEELATAFENPLIINHPQGHTVPRLDEKATEQIKSWILQCNNNSLTAEADINKKHDQVVVENGETKKEEDHHQNNKEAAVDVDRTIINNKHDQVVVENGETKKEEDHHQNNKEAAVDVDRTIINNIQVEISEEAT